MLEEHDGDVVSASSLAGELDQLDGSHFSGAVDRDPCDVIVTDHVEKTVRGQHQSISSLESDRRRQDLRHELLGQSERACGNATHGTGGQGRGFLSLGHGHGFPGHGDAPSIAHQEQPPYPGAGHVGTLVHDQGGHQTGGHSGEALLTRGRQQCLVGCLKRLEQQVAHGLGQGLVESGLGKIANESIDCGSASPRGRPGQRVGQHEQASEWQCDDLDSILDRQSGRSRVHHVTHSRVLTVHGHSVSPSPSYSGMQSRRFCLMSRSFII